MEWLFGKELSKLLNDEFVKNFIYISLLFSFWFIGIGNLSAQDREDITRMFREQEMKSWGDFIQNDNKHKCDQNIDVKFYHLDLEIALDSAYIIGNVSCKFEPTVNGLNEIRLDLDRSLTVDEVSNAGANFIQDGDEIIIQLDGKCILISSFAPGLTDT